MEQDTRARLEAAGWVVGYADAFAHLTPQESALLDLKDNLGRAVRELRNSRHITQAQLAGLMGTTQSRVAKLEAGDPRVSTDFAIRAMIAMATNRRNLARAVAGWPLASRRPVRAKTAP
jgi:predicted XRE-type DNA-binding protein